MDSFKITGAKIYKEGKLIEEDLYIKKGFISEPFAVLDKEIVNLTGSVVLPGMIDTQVHFREPGFTQKEDLISGSKQALLGGVTGFFEMPNTAPPTTDALLLQDKLTRCKGKSWVNYAFYIGATHNNISSLDKLEKLHGVCGVKIFMGSSTGSLLVSEERYLSEITKILKRRFAVHSESERLLIEKRKNIFPDREKEYDVALHPVWRDEEVALTSTQQIMSLAKKNKAKLHLLHVTTQDEMEYIEKNKFAEMTVEVTPQHLTLYAPECYEMWGTLSQMNPPIRNKKHQEALWRAVENGIVDVLGSDHAPHTREEKNVPYPKSPSGLPGVQTTLPLMLNHVAQGKLSLQKLVTLFSLNPAKIFGLQNLGEIKVGRRADLSVVDLNKKTELTKEWLQAKVGWSPFEGYKVTGFPVATIINGHLSCRDGEILSQPQGLPYTFA